VGNAKSKSSHAKAFRRDLRRAFGIEVADLVRIVRKSRDGKPGRPDTKLKWRQARRLTAREQELFEVTDYGLPVDFHSWRRSYTQALADAGINAQGAMALAGHTSMAAHQRYLANTSKAKTIPAAALPALGVWPLLGAQPQEVENENSVIDSGRDRFRTCDIRCVKPALYR